MIFFRIYQLKQQFCRIQIFAEESTEIDENAMGQARTPVAIVCWMVAK